MSWRRFDVMMTLLLRRVSAGIAAKHTKSQTCAYILVITAHVHTICKLTDLLHVLTSIPSWISNYIYHKVGDEITYPFSNFYGWPKCWKCRCCSSNMIQVEETGLQQPHYWHKLRWRHNGHNGVSNHQPHECLFNRLFRRRSKKTSKLRVTSLCQGNSPVTGEFPAQRTSNA